MFSIQKKNENGFGKIILRDELSGTFAEIAPSCGAILHAFTAKKEDREYNVIDSYTSAEDFKKNVTSGGFKGCKLSPFVCRINKGKYHFAGKDYTIEKYYDRNNALHGEIYDAAFTIVEEVADAAIVSMKYEYNGTDPGYPFLYECLVTYRLEKENQLNVITKVINKDSRQIPVQDGWHPYFKLDAKIDDLELQFQSKEMVEFDSELIPTGKLIPYTEFNNSKKFGDTFFDNCFTLDPEKGQPMCIVKNNEGNFQVEIHPDSSYPYLQFYTPPHRNSIAIENISGSPDAFNNGMGFAILDPGQSATFTTSYKITLLT